MPVSSKSQYKFFKAVENSPKLQKEKGISKETAQEYTKGMTKERWKNLKQKISTKK